MWEMGKGVFPRWKEQSGQSPGDCLQTRMLGWVVMIMGMGPRPFLSPTDPLCPRCGRMCP